MGGQKSEDRSQRSEDRGRKSEVRSRRSEDRGRKSEDRSQRSDGLLFSVLNCRLSVNSLEVYLIEF
jgi:hypothetical protein